MSKQSMMFDNNEYSVEGEESRHQEQQNVQQMQKKFSEVKIACPAGIVERDLQKRGQQQNECMYCGSNDLRLVDNQMLCHDCFWFQEKPFPAILPMLKVSIKKVITSGPDGPCEKEVREGKCTYCLHEELLTMPGDKVCRRCCDPEVFSFLYNLYKPTCVTLK